AKLSRTSPKERNPMKHSLTAAILAGLCCVGAAQADPPPTMPAVPLVGRTKPKPEIRFFSAQLQGDQLVCRANIKNLGTLATREAGLVYKAEILAGKDWLFLWSIVGGPLSPNAIVDLERTIK